MLFKNQNTGAEVNVSNLTIKNDRIFFSVRGKGCGQRFLNRNTCLVLDEHVEDGTYLKTAEGWEVIKKKKGESAPKPKPQPKPEAAVETPTEAEPQPAGEPELEAVDVETTRPDEKPAQTAANVQPQPTAAAVSTNGLNDALSAAFMPVFANVAANIEANIRASVQAEIDELKKQASTHVTTIKVVKNESETHEVEGVFCNDFEDIVEDVNDGFMPYLWGAAGCGKTHTAEQVAAALGLKFYSQTTIQFAHDVRGYGNAAGEYVPTPFYEAFANGGLYFQDEYDRSNPEASVVLNTALANGYYDFPVIGRVKAHENFRFMAAGNTRMQGADEEYVSGQVQDASNRDRVIYYEMNYDRRIELPVMAQGDEELVNFVKDVRRAIKTLRISHVVSYRETKYMKARENKKEKALIRSTFKGLEVDEIRLIYGELKDKENAWAKALKNLI